MMIGSGDVKLVTKLVNSVTKINLFIGAINVKK